MSQNTFDFSEVFSKEFLQGLMRDGVMKHPFCAFVGGGIAVGIALVLPQLAPTIESIAKHAVDKAAECYQFKVATENGLPAVNVIDSSPVDQTDESLAA